MRRPKFGGAFVFSIFHKLCYDKVRLDLADEVINPEEPWSFAHIMNTIALVTLLYGVGKLDKPSEGKKRANTAADLKPQDLMDELARSGVKYNPDEVIAVIRALDGKLMWLEKGNSKSGLTHILEKHADDFASLGTNDIPTLIKDVLKIKPINTGNNSKGLFADFVFKGQTYRMAYGTNGYIVSFYPID